MNHLHIRIEWWCPCTWERLKIRLIKYVLLCKSGQAPGVKVLEGDTWGGAEVPPLLHLPVGQLRWLSAPAFSDKCPIASNLQQNWNLSFTCFFKRGFATMERFIVFSFDMHQNDDPTKFIRSKLTKPFKWSLTETSLSMSINMSIEQ